MCAFLLRLFPTVSFQLCVFKFLWLISYMGGFSPLYLFNSVSFLLLSVFIIARGGKFPMWHLIDQIIRVPFPHCVFSYRPMWFINLCLSVGISWEPCNAFLFIWNDWHWVRNKRLNSWFKSLIFLISLKFGWNWECSLSLDYRMQRISQT